MADKKGIIAEFKEFISRGNVIDLAVGVIIGGAFTTIVNSLVNDIVMPIIGRIIGSINFTDLKIVLAPATEEVAEVAICYGTFIQNVVNFLLIAAVVFAAVKLINSFHRKEEAAEAPAEEKPVEVPEEVLLLREIRDLLNKEK